MEMAAAREHDVSRPASYDAHSGASLAGVLRALVAAALVLACVRALFDVALLARHEPLVRALALLPESLFATFAALTSILLPVALALWLAGLRRAPRIPPLAILLGVGAALLLASEVWLRAFDAVAIEPGTPPRLAPFRGALVAALATLAIGAAVLTAIFALALRRVSREAPRWRATAAIAFGAAVLCAVSFAGARIAERAERGRLSRAGGGGESAARDGRSTSASAPRRAPNILLIVMDTVRADAMSCYGQPLDATPAIDRLAREGTTFVNATSPAPWTLPAHASLFTGLYPSEHGAHYGYLHLDDDVTTMAELFSVLGYATAGFSKKTWLSREMGTLQGFREYRDFRLPAPHERLFVARMRASVRDVTRGRPMRFKDAGGAAIAAASSDWIRAHARDDGREDPSAPPFFLFLNLNEAHLPYLPQRVDFLRFARRMPTQAAMATNFDSMLYIAGVAQLAPQDLALLAALYAGEVAYVDRQIEHVIAALEETRQLDDTIVIITSDHGENIGEHGLMGHVLCVYDTLLRIPLVIRYPARFRAGALDERLVQLTDLLPTLVDVVDPDAAALLPRVSGRSFLSPDDRGFAVAEYQRPDSYLDRFPERFPNFDTSPYRRDLVSLVAGPLKLIDGSDGRRELYDVANDPGEAKNLAARDSARVADLARVLGHFRSGFERREGDDGAPALDAETREELRSLGYIQ
jgi:arylsulfatase A-like enzyme